MGPFRNGKVTNSCANEDHSSGILTPLQTKPMPLLHLENYGCLLGGFIQYNYIKKEIMSVFVLT